MALTISEEEFAKSKADLLESVGRESVFIQRDGETVAVLTSPREYETTREAKAERAVQAMWAFREQMQSAATPQELEELEKALDTHSA